MGTKKLNEKKKLGSVRDEFKQSVKNLIARRAGYRCSICDKITVGPHSEPGKSLFLGEASHITSAAPGGPRYKSNISEEERSSASNGIHLCKIHAREIDIDSDEYPEDKLFALKKQHENKIRTLSAGIPQGYDPDFLTSHETQLIHRRGNPTLSDLWISRNIIVPNTGSPLFKKDPQSLIPNETGLHIISGEQSSGRTSLLKQIVSNWIDQKNCIWIHGKDITEKVWKDPMLAISRGYQILYPNTDGWGSFLDSDAKDNVVVIDDLQRSPLNMSTKRKFLLLMEKLAGYIIVTVDDPFVLELLSVSEKDQFHVNQWRLLDLSRSDCAELTELWCRFESASTPDQDLDNKIATTQDQLELIFGKKLMPRRPVYVLTALQAIEAGTPMENHVGSYGGVYETIINFAILKNARNNEDISNERAYLQELAYFCEFNKRHTDRAAFNQWFADHKGIPVHRSNDLENSVCAKGFLSSRHQGFKYHYQKYYFLAAFLRDNPNRESVEDYIRNLVQEIWNEDYANTALFLAYLQPSSYLTEALHREVQNLFPEQPLFKMSEWRVPTVFPQGTFKGIAFTEDPDENRRKLAERLDEESPLDAPECQSATIEEKSDVEDKIFLDLLKSYHLIKLLGQLIRNAPIAFDAKQKTRLIEAGMHLSLKLMNIISEVCNTEVLKGVAINTIRNRYLKQDNKLAIESKLAGVVYNMTLFMIWSPLRHACHYLAHPDLRLTYEIVLDPSKSPVDGQSLQLISCGLDYELRTPNAKDLKRLYKDMTPAGRDILHLWTTFFISFNKVTATKKQAILESVDMGSNKQLLLPKAFD